MSLYLGTTLISPNQPNSANQSLSNINSTAQENIVDLLYPVGSIYIGTTVSCPLAAIKGTWTLVSSGIVKAGDLPCKGNGKSIGITDGSQNAGFGAYNGGFYSYTGAFDVNVGAATGTSPASANRKAYGLTTDSSKSGIIADTSSLTLSVNIWERTA